MTSGESHSSSTIETMPSTIFCRRAGMIAVCGIGSPSGWRKRAVTANQSARPPTSAASNAAERSVSHIDGGMPHASATRQPITPRTAIASEIVPT
jgi:hypothetical protein